MYDEDKFSLHPSPDIENEYILSRDFSPFSRIDFTIPAGTTAVVTKQNSACFVHFRTSVNYFNVLHHEINCLLSEAMQQYSDIHSRDRVKRVIAGLKYLHSVLLRTDSLSAISVEMVHPTEMCIDLINKFEKTQYPPTELIAVCLDVCTSLLQFVDEDIFKRVINLNILPTITNTTINDYKKYAQGNFFDSRLIGTYLVDIEKQHEHFDCFFAYLSFLRKYTKVSSSILYTLMLKLINFVLDTKRAFVSN